MARIGIFGGSFDPFHLGHLNLAIALKETHALDGVWFIPSYINPLKIETPPISFQHRSIMTQKGIADIPDFLLEGIESQRNSPSYTIDTLHLLQKLHPDTRFHLLLGEDSLAHLDRWKDIESIIKLAPPLTGSRSYNLFKVPLKLSKKSLLLLEKGLTPTPLFDISSTEIRYRIKNKLYCKHLLPTPILDYIKQNDLYC